MLKQVKRDIKCILTCKRSRKIYLNVFLRVLEYLSSPMCVGKGSPFGEKKKEKGHGALGEDSSQLSNALVYFTCI